MLHLCRFVPGLPYRARLDPGGALSLIGENGTDILFYTQFRTDPPHLVLNSAIGQTWGPEEHLPLTDLTIGPCEIVLRMAGPALTVEHNGQSHVFDRFGPAQAGAVAFVRLHWTSDPDGALIWRGETLETALTGIEAHLLHRRMDDLERRMGAPNER